MAVLPIRLYGDPVLTKKAAEVEKVDESVLKLVQDMFDTLHKAEGLGLAANQVGVLKRVFVVDLSGVKPGENPVTLINPVMLEKSGEIIGEEGCLSIPGVYEDVLRAKKVTFKGWDLSGKEKIIPGEDLLSRVMQHELDHLNGILFIEHISKVRKELLETKLNKISEKSLVSKKMFF